MAQPFQNNWTLPLATLGVLFAAIFAVYLDEFTALVDWWSRTTKYSHSLIIFPSILYLLYLKRAELKNLVARPEPRVLLLLGGAALTLPLFQLIDVQIITESLFVILFPLVIWLILGNQVAMAISWPLALLLTVIPLWELVSPALASITADVANVSLRLLGVPVFREGKFLTIPEGLFSVEEGCGGFRYFIASVSLALIYAYLYMQSVWRRILVVLLAIGLSLVSNWIRVMIVIWAGHVTDMQHPFVEAHVTLGWWIFAASLLPFFYLANKMADGGMADIQYRKSVETADKQASGSVAAFVSCGLLALFLIVSPLALQTANQFHAGRETSHAALSLPEQLPDWSGPLAYRGQWVPFYKHPDGEGRASYRYGSDVVDLYFAYYLNQSQGRELINFNHTVLNREWKVLAEQHDTLYFDDGARLRLRRIDFSTDSGHKSMWTWYYVAGTETGSDTIAKLLELKKILTANKVSAIFAVLPQTPDRESARQQVQSLLGQLYPELRLSLAKL